MNPDNILFHIYAISKGFVEEKGLTIQNKGCIFLTYSIISGHKSIYTNYSETAAIYINRTINIQYTTKFCISFWFYKLTHNTISYEILFEFDLDSCTWYVI